MSLIGDKIYAKELVYRPVTLTVLDAETKQPLEGISVVVVNVLFYSRPFIVDNITDYVYHMYKYKTNKSGIVEIPQFKYKVNRHHSLLNQVIVLNMELRDVSINIKEQADEFYSSSLYTGSNDDFFFRPRPEYKGGEFICYASSADPKQLERTKPYITVIYKKYEAAKNKKDQTSFFCDHEEFTFYLERFVEP